MKRLESFDLFGALGDDDRPFFTMTRDDQEVWDAAKSVAVQYRGEMARLTDPVELHGQPKTLEQLANERRLVVALAGDASTAPGQCSLLNGS